MDSSRNDPQALVSKLSSTHKKQCKKTRQSYSPNRILELQSDSSTDSQNSKSEWKLITPRRKPMKKKSSLMTNETSSNNKNTQEGQQESLEGPQQYSAFEYFAFQKYLQLKSEIQRRIRLKHLACGIPTVGLKYFSDEILAKEFTDIYGPLDLSLPQGDKLFNIFKDGRLDEINTWLEEEEFFNEDLPALISYIELHPVVDILTLLMDEHISNPKFNLYDQNVFTSKHNFEWFMLPRYLKKLPISHLIGNIDKQLESNITDKDNRNKVHMEIDLRVFDPKFEMPNSVWQDPNRRYSVPGRVCQKLFKIINNFNLGIQPHQIVSEWMKSEKCILDVSEFGVSNLSQFISMLPDLFSKRTMGEAVDLIFPAYLDGQMCDTYVLYLRIWHRIIFLMHYSGGSLPVDENLNKLMQIFFQLDISVYSEVMYFFLNDIYLKFPQVHQKVCFDTSSPLKPFLRFEMSPYKTKATQPKLPKIPAAFAQSGDDTKWVSKYIVQGSYSVCMGAEITSLDSFYLNPLSFWTVLKQFMKKLQEKYQVKEGFDEATVHPDCLVEGLHVAVAYNEANNAQKRGPEYHRAKILKVPTKGSPLIYEVIFIDFGDKLDVKIEDIKYLAKEFLTFFPAVAIECEVHLSDVYTSFREKNIGWGRNEILQFMKEMHQKKLSVHFHHLSSVKPISQSGKKWVVSISIVDFDNTSIIKSAHIERKVIRDNQERYFEKIPSNADEEYYSESDDPSIEHVD